MFPMPPLSIKSILYSVVATTLLSAFIYIKYLQYTISSLEGTINSQSFAIASLNQSLEDYKVAVVAANELEKEKKEIESSFSSTEAELEKLKKKVKTNECKPVNKDEVDPSRIITDDIARVLSLSDCRVQGGKDCDSIYAEGRVYHLYTP